MFSFVSVYDEPVPRIFTLIVMIASITIVLFCGIKLQLIQEHDDIGWLMLSTDYIIVKLGSEEIEYPISKATRLSLELRGYSGEPIIGEWLTSKKGYDNFMSITDENCTKKYEILITNKMKISIMDRLLSFYRQNGVVVKYADKSSIDSQNSLIARVLLAIRSTR